MTIPRIVSCITEHLKLWYTSWDIPRLNIDDFKNREIIIKEEYLGIPFSHNGISSDIYICQMNIEFNNTDNIYFHIRDDPGLSGNYSPNENGNIILEYYDVSNKYKYKPDKLEKPTPYFRSCITKILNTEELRYIRIEPMPLTVKKLDKEYFYDKNIKVLRRYCIISPEDPGFESKIHICETIIEGTTVYFYYIKIMSRICLKYSYSLEEFNKECPKKKYK